MSNPVLKRKYLSKVLGAAAAALMLSAAPLHAQGTSGSSSSGTSSTGSTPSTSSTDQSSSGMSGATGSSGTSGSSGMSSGGSSGASGSSGSSDSSGSSGAGSSGSSGMSGGTSSSGGSDTSGGSGSGTSGATGGSSSGSTGASTSGDTSNSSATGGNTSVGNAAGTAASGTSSDTTGGAASGSTGSTGATGSSATTGTTGSGAMAASGSSAKVSATDRQMMRQLAQSNMAEIETAKMAQEKSSNEEVKKFAQQMIDDHTKALDQLTQVAQQKGIDLPSQPDAKHQKMAKKMQALSGDAFDRQYMAHAGTAAHKQAHQLVTKASKSAKDPDLKTLASQMQPTIVQHMEMAKDLRQDVASAAKGGQSQSTGSSGGGSGK